MLLTVRFGTESAMLAALAVAGAEAGAGPAARIGLAVLGPVLAAAVWGLLIAPAARRRLPDPGRFLVEIVLFLTAAAALTATDHAAVPRRSRSWRSAPRSWSARSRPGPEGTKS